MKKVKGFWESLEAYLVKVIERSPLPAMLRIALQAGLPRYWRWMAVGIVLVVIASSTVSAKNSAVGFTTIQGLVERSARLGDYATARDLYTHYTKEPLSQFEDLVYPERKVERRIVELEDKLLEYPVNRQIYLGLVQLYTQIGNSEKAEEYRERARILDPNGNEFK